MTKQNKRQTYPKDDADTMRDTIQKLKSQVRRLQKTIRELKSENSTLIDAWSKTEAFLSEVTEGAPLEEVIKYNKLPKKAVRKKTNKVNKVNEQDAKEVAREKWAKWRKENL